MKNFSMSVFVGLSGRVLSCVYVRFGLKNVTKNGCILTRR